MDPEIDIHTFKRVYLFQDLFLVGVFYICKETKGALNLIPLTYSSY
jgi:hypothetical protein